MAKDETFWERLSRRFAAYASPSLAADWLDRNAARVRELFRNVRIRDVIFEPIKDVFSAVGDSSEARVRSVITQVAVSNAVLAGLPGQMGVGVVVCMGLEGWMAYTIAKEVGLKIERLSDVWKYFGLLGGIALTIMSVFKVLLGFAFSLFSVLPWLNPMIPAELFVTDLVGVLFWVGFEAAKDTGTFKVPSTAVGRVISRARNLFDYQIEIVRRGLSPTNLRRMATRLWSYLKGEVPIDAPHVRGEIMATACMAWLLEGRYDDLKGPMGAIFIESIRDRYPDLAHASVSDISAHMAQYEPDQLQGVISLIKGRMFELYEIGAINGHDDGWVATSEPDMSHPGDDIILTNEDTGKQIFLQLKATDSPSYIEHALQRYPDVPILTTDEVSQHFGAESPVHSTGVTNAKLEAVTHENFDRLVAGLTPVHATEVAAGGIAARAIVRLWPFVIAKLRGRISQEQLENAFSKVLGDSGVALAARIGYSLVFDAIFAWYLLARGTMTIVRAGQKLEASQPEEETASAWIGGAAPAR